MGPSHGSDLAGRLRDVEIRVEQHDAKIASLELARDHYIPIIETLADAAMIEDALKKSQGRMVKIIVGSVGLINVLVTTVLAVVALLK